MKVIKRGVMPDKTITHEATNIQIEDWSEDYSFYNFCETVAAYPVAKDSIRDERGSYYPEAHRKFRLEINFETSEKAEEAFNNLISGKSQLKDYAKYFRHPIYVNCL